jgi:hypothetical protein
MKSVCVIGTSHLASYKLGWDSIKEEFPGIALDFFGAPGSLLREELEVAGGALVPKSADAAEKFVQFCGRSRITGDYDYFLLCDIGVRSGFALRLYSKWRAEVHAGAARIPVSNEVFQLALHGLLREQYITELVGNIRRISAAPIAITPAPMRGADHPDPWRKAAQENGDETSLSEMFSSAVRELASDLEVGVFLQPAATLVSPLYTNSIFTRAAGIQTDDGSEDPTIDKDFGHMSGLYGAAVLRDFIPKMLRSPRNQRRYAKRLSGAEPWSVRMVQSVRRIVGI